MYARLRKSAATRVCVALAVAILASAALLSQASKQAQVLFLCPHGAAKSVLASTYFKELAAQRGLRVVVDFAGTEPDPAIAPVVANHLKQHGYPVPARAPRLVTDADVHAADIVISLGCDLARVPGTAGKDVRQWEVPGPGEHLDESAAAIRARVIELVDELVKRQQ